MKLLQQVFSFAGVARAAPSLAVFGFATAVLAGSGRAAVGFDHTTVALEDGSLVIGDSFGAANQLTLSRSGSELLVSDAFATLVAETGVTQETLNQVRVPLAAITGDIQVSAGGGDDTLILDYAGGDLPFVVEYAGGGNQSADPGDQLVLQNGIAGSITFGYLNAHDGSVQLAAGLGTLINYTGLEPISSTINAADVFLNYAASTETITITDAGGGQTTVDSTLGEVTTFNNPTARLWVDSGGGNDTINLNSLGSGSFNFEIRALTGSATANLNADPTAAFLQVAAETIRLNTSPITASGAQYYTFLNLALGGGTSASQVSLVAGGEVQLSGTLNVDLNGTAPASGYDQLVVPGSVSLVAAELDLSLTFIPSPGDTFILLTTGGLTGEFIGLPHGSVTNVNGRSLRIDYQGGDGNDVSLTDVTPPEIPQNLAAVGNHLDGTVDLSWDPSPGATGYLVFRNTSNSHAGEFQIAGPIPGTTLQDGTVAAGTEYFYWVQAANAAATSDYSQVSSLKFGPLRSLGPWVAQEPLGSLTYRRQLAGDEAISPAGDIDPIEVELEAGETLSVLIQPQFSLQANLTVTGPGGGVLGAAAGGGGGQWVAVQNIPLAVSGVYTIAVSGGAGSTGDYECNLLVNGSFEEEVYLFGDNGTLATAEDLDPVFAALPGSSGETASVLGASPYFGCGSPLYEESFDGGLGGFVINNAAGSGNGLWHASTGRSGDGQPNHSPPGSLYYGQNEDANGNGDYVTGAANGGVATSPPIAVPAAEAVILGLSHLLETEGIGDFDVARIEVVTTNGLDVLAGTSDGSLPLSSSWTQLLLDLTPYTGQTIQVQFSFDTVDGANNAFEGWYIDDIVICATSFDPDVFQLTLAPGQAATLAASRLPGFGAIVPPRLELVDAAGNLLTTGSVGSTADAFIGPLLPAGGGTFFIRVRTIGFYQLHVTRDLLFAGDFVEATLPGFQHGHTATGPFFRFRANAGDPLVLETQTPGDGPLSFDNPLDPGLRLFSASGDLLAQDDDSAADGKNAQLIHPAPSNGLYYAEVVAAGDPGEYLLGLTGSTAASAAFRVLTVNPPDGSAINTPVSDVQIAFNGSILLSSLDASDLLVNGVPATAVALPDGPHAPVFTIPLAGAGSYTLSLAAGAVQRADGTPLEAFSSTFTIDTTPPIILAGSIDDGSILDQRDLTFVTSFNEPLDPATVIPGNVAIQPVSTGFPVAADTLSFDTNTLTLTATFSGVAEGDYLGGVFSGGVTDLAGNALDGEALGPGTDGAPTGDGSAGGNYVVSFSVEYGTVGYGPFEALPPLGGLVYDPPVAAAISPAGDSDSFTVGLDSNQTLTVVVDPAPGLQPLVQVFDPANSPLALAAGAGAGLDLVIQTVAVTSPGTYRVAVSGNAGTTGGYTVELLLNAAAEEEEHDGLANDTIGTAQDLSPAFVALGDGVLERAAVVGEARSVPTLIADFESGLDGFTIDNAFGAGNGQWHRSTGRQSDGDPTHSPPFSLYFGAGETATGGGGYANNAEGAVYSPAIAIPATGGNLLFSSFLDTENGFDFARVAVSTNGLPGPFVEVAASSNTLQNVSAWVTESIDLDAFANAQVTLRFSFDTDSSVTNEGWYLDDIRLETDTPVEDYYAVSLQAGEPVSCIAAPVDGGQFPLLELLDVGGGSVLATSVLGDGTHGRIAAASRFDDVFVPASGTYPIRVTGSASRYNLVVVRNGGVDAEDNEQPIDAMPAPGNGRVLGYVGSGDFRDTYAATVSAGDAIVARSWTPGDGPGDPINPLNLRMELYDPAVNLVATNQADNTPLVHLARVAGKHYLSLSAFSVVGGEYVLRVSSIAATNDFDMDGLSDAWEFVYGLSTNDNGSVAVTNGPLGDADMDGANNAAEAGAGTNPNDSNSVFRIVGGSYTPTPVEVFVAPFNTVPGKSYAFDYTDGNRDGSYTWNTYHSVLDTFVATGTVEGTLSLLDDFSFGRSGGAPADGWRAYRARIAQPPAPFLQLTDGAGFPWRLNDLGEVEGLPGSAFDFGMANTGVSVAAEPLRPGVSPRHALLYDDPGNPEVRIVRRVYVSPTGGFARWLDLFHNPATTSQTYTAFFTSDVGSDGNTQIISTSSGDSLVDTNDNWVVSDDASIGGGDPTVVQVFAGPGALRPDFAGFPYGEINDVLGYGYTLTLAPGETRILMHFAAQEVNIAPALTKGAALENLTLPGALAGISDADRARIVNFNVPLP